MVTYVVFPLLVCVGATDNIYKQRLGLLADPRVLALTMSLGPLVVGIALLGATSRRPFATPRLTYLYPFHKERWLGAFGLNVVISLAVTVLPVYHMIHMFLSEPGQGVYFTLYGK